MPGRERQASGSGLDLLFNPSRTKLSLKPLWLHTCKLPPNDFFYEVSTKVKVLRIEPRWLFRIPTLLPLDRPVFPTSGAGFQSVLSMISTNLRSPQGGREGRAPAIVLSEKTH